ncbi:hypothetical protein [Runella sp. SP2]|uniref:hypothetical protein n=1 Tax=Runella sp. SP2 TaxID=2268026 RepID=UPI000F081A9A|nr:hypothetical protein [Runella sp. SP2]AYQ32991.1 hypothetical protein DTQ70_12880 [Runella sp. SP2]
MTLTEKILVSSKDNFTIAHRIKIAIEESNKLFAIYENESVNIFNSIFDWLTFLDSEGYPQLQDIDSIIIFFTLMQASSFVEEINKYLKVKSDDDIFQFYRLNENIVWGYLVKYVSTKVVYFPN